MELIKSLIYVVNLGHNFSSSILYSLGVNPNLKENLNFFYGIEEFERDNQLSFGICRPLENKFNVKSKKYNNLEGRFLKIHQV